KLRVPIYPPVLGSDTRVILGTDAALTSPRFIIDGVEATLIDNGMPCVIMRASDFGLSGTESREDLEVNEGLKQRIEVIRLKAGPMMNLG
ncbi:PrpF domain-containing protein, partial [Rhizobium johnstonii]|uniref:PrpF domain-containing protein n=1 Tax=Rhizobium johnstonii TaxID=3019933 RepID=UPI003F9A39E5